MTSTKMCSVALFLLSTILLASGTKVNKCSDGNLPDSVSIQNCDQPPCILILDTNVTFSMDFTAPSYLEKIAPRVIATVDGIDIPYFIGDDACDGIENTSCPIEEGEPVTYSFSMRLSSTFIPETSLTLTFSIIDKLTDQTAICFKVDLQTKKK